MSRPETIPSCRSLDIYRLVVVRSLKQSDVAQSFGISPARVCQVVRRVRGWVNHSVADWLFPRRDDLRFYVALEWEQIHPFESQDEPESILLVGPGWSYSRQHGEPSATQLGLSAAEESSPQLATQPELNLSTQPLDPDVAAKSGSVAATSCGESDCDSPATVELAYRMAHLLTIWKKSKKLSPPGKPPSPGGRPA